MSRFTRRTTSRITSRITHSRRTRLIAGLAAAIMALTAAGVFAYWTSSGEGSGEAKANYASASFEVSSAAVEGLYPGDDPAVAVKVKDKDANQAEYLTKLEAEVEKTSAAECKKEWFVVSPASQEPKVLIAHGETKEYTVHLEMKEEATVNQNACKGATVTLKYKAS